MDNDPRTTLIDRLVVDLIGPEAQDEVLDDRPVDRYLTGILYPQRTELEPREQDDGSSEAGTDGTDDTSESEVVNTPNLRKPASMGLSFRVRAATGTRGTVTIPVEISGGRYERRRQGEAADGAGAGRSADAPRPRSVWHRVPVRARYAVAIDMSGATSVTPDGMPALDGFTLHAVAAPNGDEWVVTVALVNLNDLGDEKNRGRQDELALFQSSLRVLRPEGWSFSARPVNAAFDDEDSRIAALIYRDVREYAVGHTCGATWRAADDDVVFLETTWLPTAEVPLVSAEGGPHLMRHIREVAPQGLLASLMADPSTDIGAVLTSVPDGYAAWIAEQEMRIATLEPHLQEQAKQHVETCRASERRIRGGIDCILRDPDCRASFRLMNRAMALQRTWTDTDGRPLAWRPFQLAFILQCLPSLADRHAPDRDVMDLLWFPTGGGKTEAYLGLIAFVLFLRRIRAPERGGGAGVACLMRYTLRLLTLQQFERASALTLACEHLRRGAPRAGEPDLRESAEISIGLWVGGSATPNTVAEAIEALRTPNASSSPKQLEACPACRTALRWAASEDRSRLVVQCTNAECELRARMPVLPVMTVDDMIYDRPPSLLIGTIDKFAQLVRRGETRRLFGVDGVLPPDLVIQDELHLISGPLGSLAGLYESAIDRLTVHDGQPAKVIGSTATIRRAADQVRALFNRQVAQFPPPGLDATDSCFAVVPEGAQVRRYVGLTTAGRSAKFALQAAYASLAQSAPALPAEERNGYHTLVGYFNALRELGGALPLAQDDTLASIRLIARRRGETPRALSEIVELTSRVSQTEIRSILTRLNVAAGKDDAVDVLLATNMISVGVDVSRLGLMVVMGQPKTASEYIQATSRVGRDARMPGLVLTILNSNKTRDRSHFETFTAWHGAIYRGVEATSVTPFASRARDKALHAALVLAARHLVPGMQDAPQLEPQHEDTVREIAEGLLDRIAAIDGEELDDARQELDEIIMLWQDRSHVITTYWNDFAPRKSLLVAAEKAAARQLASRSASTSWPTLNAMRNVEPTTQVKLVEALADAR